MRIMVLAFTAAITLAACSPAPETKTEAPIASSSAFSVDLRAPDQMSVPRGSPITVTPVEGALRLAGNVPNGFTYGATQGASVKLDAAHEQAISGHRVRVTLRARSPDGATAFNAAYSTADVGNSEWRELPLSAEWADVGFNYQVQTLNRGLNDYIGIMPPAAGSVEVQSIRVDFLPGAAATEIRE